MTEGGKLLFGHQEIISHLSMNPSKSFILTVDEAKKIKITNFPKVVLMHSIDFARDKVQNAFFINDYVFLTYSKNDKNLSLRIIEGDKTNLLIQKMGQELIEFLENSSDKEEL